jgi:acetyl-CoA acetyltransferase
MRDSVIVSAVRTPIARFQGGFASLKAPQLGGFAIKEAVARARIRIARVGQIAERQGHGSSWYR